MRNQDLDDYVSMTRQLMKANLSVYKNFLDSMKEKRRYDELRQINSDFTNKICELAAYLKDRVEGRSPEPIVKKLDNRFKNPTWDKSPVLDFLKQMYFLTSDWLQNVTDVKREDADVQARFVLKQMLDACSPTNVPFLNPDVVSEFLKTGGESVARGARNFLRDIDKDGLLSLPTADMDYFKLGVNIATTPGKVIYQNDMMQLIQYEPVTKEVHSVPILIISPWINKYYVMDLSGEKSFVRWLVENGYTVFVVSWVNPGKAHAEKSFEHYLSEGLLSALDQINKAVGAEETNVIGYCLGGTLLASGIAYLNNKLCKHKPKNKVKTATLIATLTDFSNVGDFSVFINDAYIKKIEKIMDKHGYLPGKIMFKTFNLLKANDMIWSTVLRNYLMGKDPIQMDVLYWNADYTNMAKAAHSFLLRNLYQKNLLKKPNGIKLFDVGIDLKRVDVPVFMLSTLRDHIAPWKSTYSGTKLFSGPTKFVVGGSGHVAGVVNHINSGKYGYWTNSKLYDSADEWMKTAQKHAGSWWEEWQNWIDEFSGKMVKARDIKKWIEDAPGSYVRGLIPTIKYKGKKRTSKEK